MKLGGILSVAAIPVLSVLVPNGDAGAIALPDNSSCSTTGANGCFKISNTNASSSALGLIGSVAAGAGVKGVATSSGTGIIGQSASGIAILATSTSGPGVLSITASGVAVKGQSSSTTGVEGTSGGASSSAVLGTYSNAAGSGSGVTGVVPAASTGAAVLGDAANSFTAWAGFFSGDVSGRDFFGVSFNPSSDLRLKKDIVNAPYGLREVMKLRPVTYKWRQSENDSGTQIGLIAQEVKEILPELVRARGSADTLSLNYNGLVPVVVAAVQEQQRVVQDQQKTIQQLVARIDALERGSRSGIISSKAKGGVGAVAALGLLPLGLFVARRRKKASAPDTHE